MHLFNKKYSDFFFLNIIKILLESFLFEWVFKCNLFL